MTATFLESLTRLGQPVKLADKAFSKTVAEVGSFSAAKLIRIPFFYARLCGMVLAHRPGLAVSFIATSMPALIVDALAIFCLRVFGVRYLLYLHGRGLTQLGEARPTLAWLIRSVVNNASGIVCLTPRLRSDVEPFLRERVPISVIPNAIEDKPGVAHRPTARSVRVLYLSNLEPAKGAREFVEAAARVRSRSVTFVLAGSERDPQFSRDLRDLISRTGLSERVQLVGAVYGEAKLQLFAESDIFVFPTRYRYETFGLVNLEAMRAALPVIATDVGGIRDVVHDGETGIIVGENDRPGLVTALDRLIEDEALRRRMGAAGRRRFEERFTLARYDENWRELLLQLLPTGDGEIGRADLEKTSSGVTPGQKR